MPRKAIRTRAFNTKISPEHAEKARKLAERGDMSQADLVEQMINQAWSDRYGRKRGSGGKRDGVPAG